MKRQWLGSAAAILGALFYATAASALTDDRPLAGTTALGQSGREITVEGRREAPRRGEVEVDGTVTRAGRDLRVSTGRSVIRVATSSRVPVHYGGRVYRVTDLEVGDRVRIIGKLRRNGVDARWIGVVSSVSDRRYDRRNDRRDDRRQGAVSGLITSIDHRRETIRLRTSNGRTIVVDAHDVTRRGRSEVRFDRLRAGDRITVVGRFTTSEVFRAEAIQIAGSPRGRHDREEWREGSRGRY